MSMNRRLKILEILGDHPAGLFGLDIVRISNRKISRASVYIYLADLEDDGLVLREAVPQQPPLTTRDRFKLTDKGRRVLDEGFDALGAFA